jgi:hypothetical protein
MTPWRVTRERKQMQMALLLLVVSGIIRPANLDSFHFGAETTLAVPPGDPALTT